MKKLKDEFSLSDMGDREPEIIAKIEGGMNKDPNYIHVKVAAAEVHKEARMARTAGMIGVASTVLTAIFMTAGKWAGAAAACVFSFFLVYLIAKAIQRMNYLRNNYNLKR